MSAGLVAAFKSPLSITGKGGSSLRPPPPPPPRLLDAKPRQRPSRQTSSAPSRSPLPGEQRCPCVSTPPLLPPPPPSAVRKLAPRGVANVALATPPLDGLLVLSLTVAPDVDTSSTRMTRDGCVGAVMTSKAPRTPRPQRLRAKPDSNRDERRIPVCVCVRAWCERV